MPISFDFCYGEGREVDWMMIIIIITIIMGDGWMVLE